MNGGKIQDAERLRKSNQRDTKRWCRGKVGVEHVTEWVNYCTLQNPSLPVVHDFPWEQQVCLTCGRRLKVRPKDGKDNRA